MIPFKVVLVVLFVNPSTGALEVSQGWGNRVHPDKATCEEHKDRLEEYLKGQDTWIECIKLYKHKE